jgi:DNA-binding FadR family transcriptional regulator
MSQNPILPPTYPVPRGRELAELILRECTRAATPVGGRLPTERQLAESLGLTRAAVRHALGVLEAEGRVSREVGRGTFLRAVAPSAPDGPPLGALKPDDVSPADVMNARDLFEPRVVPLVVAHATVRDFDELERCIAGGNAAETSDEFEAWDYALHHAIVAAAHNSLLLRMYAGVEAARHGQLWGSLKRRNDSPYRRATYQADHRKIVDALQARELDSALAATNEHLDRVRANLLGVAETSEGLAHQSV